MKQTSSDIVEQLDAWFRSAKPSIETRLLLRITAQTIGNLSSHAELLKPGETADEEIVGRLVSLSNRSVIATPGDIEAVLKEARIEINRLRKVYSVAVDAC